MITLFHSHCLRVTCCAAIHEEIETRTQLIEMQLFSFYCNELFTFVGLKASPALQLTLPILLI